MFDNEFRGNKCVLQLGTVTMNPFKEWLKKMDFPHSFISQDTVAVQWNHIDAFYCNTSVTKAVAVDFKATLGDFVIKKRRTNIAIDKPIVLDELNHTSDLRCLPLTLEVKLTLELLKYEGKIFGAKL